MRDTRDGHNIMPHSIMKNLGLECTQTFHFVLAMDSWPVKIVGEIRDLLVWIHYTPQITMVMNVTIV